MEESEQIVSSTIVPVKQSSLKKQMIRLIIVVIISFCGGALVTYLFLASALEKANTIPQPINQPTIIPTQTEKSSQNSIIKNEEAALLEVAKAYCLDQGKSPCNTSLDKRKNNIVSVKTESMIVLLSKESSNQWRVILANDSDNDICATGSDNLNLKELCSD